jgi:hypothetical protein
MKDKKKKKEKNYDDYCHTFEDYVVQIIGWIIIAIFAAFVILVIAGLCVSYKGPGTQAYKDAQSRPRVEVKQDSASIAAKKKKKDDDDSPLKTIVPIVIANIVTSPNFGY